MKVEQARTLASLLRGTKREVERGQVLTVPGAITPHTKFEAEVYVLSKTKADATTILQGLSAAVLLPNDGCNGCLRAS